MIMKKKTVAGFSLEDLVQQLHLLVMFCCCCCCCFGCNTVAADVASDNETVQIHLWFENRPIMHCEAKQCYNQPWRSTSQILVSFRF